MRKSTLGNCQFVAIGCLLLACHSGTERELLAPQGQAGDTGDGSVDAAIEAGVGGRGGTAPTVAGAGSGGGGTGGFVGAAGDGGIAGGGALADHELPDAEASETGSDADAEPQPSCGDGNVDLALDEECDDGNRQHSDGCELDCKPTTIEDVAIGYTFHCALSSGGGIKCWGQDSFGQLGRGTKGADITNALLVPPLDFGTTRRVTQLSTGYGHACVVFEDNRARCWGRNESGQLGIDSQNDWGDDADEPLDQRLDLPFTNVRSIVAGRYSTCAIVGITGFEQQYCWGSNTLGELGISSSNVLLDEPGNAVGLNARSLATQIGERWVCALLHNGAARCWGDYLYGVRGVGAASSYLGDNELPDQSSDNVKGLPGPVSMISAGRATSCAISAGDVYCWGRNESAEAGYPVGTYGTEIWQTPGKVNLGDISIVQVSAGWTSSCALDDEGFVYCWGNDPDDGQLGYAGVTKVGFDREPVLDYALMGGDGGLDAGTPGLPLGAVDLGDFDAEPGPDRATKVVTGPDRACALMENGGLRCWGENTGAVMGYPVDVGYIGRDETPAQGYQQLGYSDPKIFGPAPSDQ